MIIIAKNAEIFQIVLTLHQSLYDGAVSKLMF